jgi:hypothetical protein
MARAKRQELKPTQVYIPIFIPTEDGVNGDLELGKGSIRGDTLIIEFNQKLPAVAIKRRIERGELVGITFVIPDDEAEDAREEEEERKKREMTQHERDLADLELLRDGEEVTPEDFSIGEFRD